MIYLLLLLYLPLSLFLRNLSFNIFLFTKKSPNNSQFPPTYNPCFNGFSLIYTSSTFSLPPNNPQKSSHHQFSSSTIFCSLPRTHQASQPVRALQPISCPKLENKGFIFPLIPRKQREENWGNQAGALRCHRPPRSRRWGDSWGPRTDWSGNIVRIASNLHKLEVFCYISC